jgi:hypothetical protein
MTVSFVKFMVELKSEMFNSAGSVVNLHAGCKSSCEMLVSLLQYGVVHSHWQLVVLVDVVVVVVDVVVVLVVDVV